MQDFNELVSKVTSLTNDAAKTAAGNKTAGIRLRKGMQETIKLARKVRAAVLEVRADV